jgi:hypothetical protein
MTTVSHIYVLRALCAPPLPVAAAAAAIAAVNVAAAIHRRHHTCSDIITVNGKQRDGDTCFNASLSV